MRAVKGASSNLYGLVLSINSTTKMALFLVSLKHYLILAFVAFKQFVFVEVFDTYTRIELLYKNYNFEAERIFDMVLINCCCCTVLLLGCAVVDSVVL